MRFSISTWVLFVIPPEILAHPNVVTATGVRALLQLQWAQHSPRELGIILY
jgi:hypothetical protein